MAAVVNLLWGTDMVGGNTTSPNRPVEYMCKHPFPSKHGPDPERLQTSYLAGLIDEFGPENVMFLAKSVQNENCPIRVHVNELMTIKENGRQKYNFHVKENIRGFEGKADVKNKVRVWTFCGAKGCEADCVVVFGLDVMDFSGPIPSLNQVCVALSRARKLLIPIHGKTSTSMTDLDGENIKKDVAFNYFPVLGDVDFGTRELSHTVRCNGRGISLKVPPCTGNTASEKAEVLAARSKLTAHALARMKQLNIISGDLPDEWNSRISSNVARSVVYSATEFSYFSASEVGNFLKFGEWAPEGRVDAGHRLEYTMNVQFERTKEDVSALYGEAVNLMLQWKRNGYCPNVETVVNGGVLWFHEFAIYSQVYLEEMITQKRYEALTVSQMELLSDEYKSKGGKDQFGEQKLTGKDIVSFVNSRLRIRKKRIIETLAEDGTLVQKTIYFPVLAKFTREDDKLMRLFLRDVEKAYDSSNKTMADWVYLSNAIMGFGGYHEKWQQVGTERDSYSGWVESTVLQEALNRLQELMKNTGSQSGKEGSEADDYSKSVFERPMQFDFPTEIEITNETKSHMVVGVNGICDWVGEGLVSPNGKAVDLLEIKFVNELCDEHRLQVLVYCALLALEKNAPCSGMLFNARTCETEVVTIEANRAAEFLPGISQFKCDGTKKTFIAPEPVDDDIDDMTMLMECDRAVMERLHTKKRALSPEVVVLDYEPVTNDAMKMSSQEVAMVIPTVLE
eukprot:CAMPEP_0184719236 /NCGR_PEP_ID=MMETSP0314-20130426/8213_1 /TAXON_ID=38298 /ORGANISM="Rhodella maculata, Strain CCMP 736" /LENGTH=734 /DNA_ID=CAMNT_0027183097 /DNA_START=62 /DNA_END=2266 /DNA_ORIENTATION=+